MLKLPMYYNIDHLMLPCQKQWNYILGNEVNSHLKPNIPRFCCCIAFYWWLFIPTPLPKGLSQKGDYKSTTFF
jgi:hypothetical protein